MLESNPSMGPYFNYVRDAFERSILFLDVLRSGEMTTLNKAVEQPRMC